MLKSPFTTSLASRVLGISLGLLGAALAGQPKSPNALRNTAVLCAAPVSWTFTGREIVGCSKLNSPPPYTKVTSLNLQFLQANPSTSYRAPSIVDSAKTKSLNGGTTGAQPPQTAKVLGGLFVDSCANVDVWFPRNDMQIAPRAKDTNDSIIFRISSPSVGVCRKWVYHYGTDLTSNQLSR